MTSLTNVFKVKDKVKVIETNMSIILCDMHKSTVMLSLNAIAYILFSSADRPLWPCIKVKIIETSTSIYDMHKSTVMHGLSAMAEIIIVRDITMLAH